MASATPLSRTSLQAYRPAQAEIALKRSLESSPGKYKRSITLKNEHNMITFPLQMLVLMLVLKICWRIKKIYFQVHDCRYSP